MLALLCCCCCCCCCLLLLQRCCCSGWLPGLQHCLCVTCRSTDTAQQGCYAVLLAWLRINMLYLQAFAHAGTRMYMTLSMMQHPKAPYSPPRCQQQQNTNNTITNAGYFNSVHTCQNVGSQLLAGSCKLLTAVSVTYECTCKCSDYHAALLISSLMLDTSHTRCNKTHQ